MIPAENVVGVHKVCGALVVRNLDSLSFCVGHLADVPDVEIEFDEQRPCNICQVHGGPVNHARIPGQKHDYVTPLPEVIAFSDSELSESRAQIPNMKNARLRMQLERLYATVDYWMAEARNEANLRQPALDDRDAALRKLQTTLEAVDLLVEERLAARSIEQEAQRIAAEKEAERVCALRKEFIIWPFPLMLRGQLVSLKFEVIDLDAMPIEDRS